MGSPFPQTDSLTAEQYHRLRAGPVGAGHVEPLEAVEPVPRLPLARVCRRCGTPFDGPPSKVWCSDKCRARSRSAPAKPAAMAGERSTTPLADAAGLVAALVARPGWTEMAITFDEVTVTVTPRP